MPAWPLTLPAAPLLDACRDIPADIVLRTRMEQGPAKLRRRTTAGVGKLQLAYILSMDETADLETFYRETLLGGTLAFDFTHPRSGDAISCRFARPPEFQPVNGDYFRAAVEFEVMP